MHIDILGQPISVGDTILTKSPYSATFDTVQTVASIGPVRVIYRYNGNRQRVYRNPSEVLVLTHLLPSISEAQARFLATPPSTLTKKLKSKTYADRVNFAKYLIYDCSQPIRTLAKSAYNSYGQALLDQLQADYPEYSI